MMMDGSEVANIKNDPLERQRQTGRSTRMMLAAAMAASSGSKVVALFKDEASAKPFREKFGKIPRLIIEPMKVEQMKNEQSDIDWLAGKLIGDRNDHLLFIDHDAYYAKFKHVLRGWTAYDNPPGVEVTQAK